MPISNVLASRWVIWTHELTDENLRYCLVFVLVSRTNLNMVELQHLQWLIWGFYLCKGVYCFSLRYLGLQMFYFSKTNTVFFQRHGNCPEAIKQHLLPVAGFMDMWRQVELRGGKQFRSSGCMLETVFFFSGLWSGIWDKTIKVKIWTTATEAYTYYFHIMHKCTGKYS